MRWIIGLMLCGSILAAESDLKVTVFHMKDGKDVKVLKFMLLDDAYSVTTIDEEKITLKAADVESRAPGVVAYADLPKKLKDAADKRTKDAEVEKVARAQRQKAGEAAMAAEERKQKEIATQGATEDEKKRKAAEKWAAEDEARQAQRAFDRAQKPRESRTGD